MVEQAIEGTTYVESCSQSHEPRVRRNDPPGTPVIILDQPVAVVVTVDGKSWPGFAEQWRGRWVYTTWSCGVGLQHLGWVLGQDVARV